MARDEPQEITAVCWSKNLPGAAFAPLNNTPGCINTYLTKSGLNLIDIGI
ncbi:Uncharacterised protein [Legionella pneumophila]|nr:Uncharacterised protein [Legionella pneumophila]CZG59928.1 Uncharacterised protein [Legionella pneumophila]CZG60576.1 Uncharacterised protein [Legionella pneumophila]CZG76900.1 Uncharacterised protein [Legionella pneumophila]CZG79013.1 Uncharacterised protein [Legionella pneumophila]